MSLVIFSHQLSLSYARSLTLSETKWLHSKYELFEHPAVCQWQHYEKLHVMQFGAGCSSGLTVLLSLCSGPHFKTAILLNELMVLFYKNIFHFKMTDYKSTMWIYYTISHLFTYNPTHCRSCILRDKARRVLYAARKFPSKQYYFILKFSYIFRPQPPPSPYFRYAVQYYIIWLTWTTVEAVLGEQVTHKMNAVISANRIELVKYYTNIL